MSVGAYAFSLDNWKEMQYPLDLWIRHNSKYFDQLSLVFIGDPLKCPPLTPNTNVIYIREISQKTMETWDIYRIFKQIAHDNMKTDWRVLLDIDEMIDRRIDVDKLDPHKIYAIGYHHLFARPDQEIIGAFPDYHWRVHCGDTRIVRDGTIDGIKSKHFSPHVPTWKVKSLYYQVRKNGIRRMLYMPDIVAHVWHTNTLRDPQVMKKKWKTQIQRAVGEGKEVKLDKFNENLLSDEAFTYDDFLHTSYFSVKEVKPPDDVRKYFEHNEE